MTVLNSNHNRRCTCFCIKCKKYYQIKKMEGSYLQARDPSIISYNRTNLREVKMDLRKLLESNSEITEVEQTPQSEENLEEQTESTSSDEDKYIKVYLRIRGDIPLNEIYQIDGDVFIYNVPENSLASRNLKAGGSMKRTYSFSKIFDPNTDQRTLFNSIVKPKLLSFINGRNSTLFTYGASGSGKTFTIVGTPDEPGLIPRALEYVFRSLPKLTEESKLKPLPNGRLQQLTQNMLKENTFYKCTLINATLFDQTTQIRTYKQMQQRLSSEPVAEVSPSSDVSACVWVSFTEIYNETVYDLLRLPTSKNEPRPKLGLGKTDDENTYIKNLTYINVNSGLEAYQILQYGLHNLNYAATAINSHSSRSHCIFTVKLVQSCGSSQDVYVSNFNFCDLAGSERSKKTMNLGVRLKESNKINTSLLVLGRCIENIRKCQQIKDNRLMPFRESKLTQIFQKALLGYENLEMIVNINPSTQMFDETLHVLNFSAIARTIVVEEELPKPIRRQDRFSIMMQKEANENKEVKNGHVELNTQQAELRRLRRENQRLKAELSQRSIDCDKDEEIKLLHRGIDQVISERDEIVEIYENKLKQQKEFLTLIHAENIARLEEMHLKMRESYVNSIREHYEKQISEMQVITISSSDEEDDDSPKKLNYKPRIEMEKEILEFRNLVHELTDQLNDKESLLEDAKAQYRFFEEEVKRYTNHCNKLKSENVALHEEVESLKLQLLHKSTFLSSEDSNSDTEEIENYHKKSTLEADFIKNIQI